MKVRELTQGAERSWAVVFATGEDPMEGLRDFARRQRLDAAHLTAIGAFERATLGFFEMDRNDYHRIPVEEQAEVVSLIGNVTLTSGGDTNLHVHAVLGRRDGQTVAGHLLDARVRPTLEVVVTETPGHLRRRHDPATGLDLLTE